MSSPVEKKLAAFSSLIEVAAAINASLEPDDVLPSIMAMALRVMDAEAGSVALMDEATNDLVYVVATGEFGERVKAGIRPRIGPNSIAGWVAQNDKALVITDVANDPRFDLAAAKKIGMIPRSMVCVPMRARGKVIGILQAIDPRNKLTFDADDGDFFEAFGSLAATAIQNARLHKAVLKQQSEQKERDFARQIQQSFLPKQMPQIAGITIHGYCEPARDMSGDFYDVLQLSPTKVGLVVADVTGKGLASALHMVRCLFGSRRLIASGLSPAAALAEINRTLAEESVANLNAEIAAGRMPRPPIFLGMLYATFDTATRELRYANAGMPDPLLCTRGGSVTLSATGGPSLGMVPDISYDEGVRTLADNETVLLFTDGLSEARNLGKTEFGYERIGQALAQSHDTAEAAVRLVSESVLHFAGSADRHDDLTFLAMHYAGDVKPTLTIKSHPRHMADVRQFVRRITAQAQLPQDVTFNIVLAVDEAIANIIRHAYEGDDNQNIIMTAEVRPDAVEFRLRDFGKQVGRETIHSRKLEDVRPGGLGCHLIAQVFDTVKYNTAFEKGTELRLVKKLR